ncbi:MAG: type II secretion system F family protein, partial [Pseudomonadales bacterium]
MPSAKQIYAWQGTDRHGRKAKGELLSASVGLAKATLRRQGVRPDKVARKSAGSSFARLFEPGIKPADIALFTRQLAAMIKAGVPLVQSFEIVADGLDKPPMRNIILKIRDEVAGGSSFTQAVRLQPSHFDQLYCNLINAGEQSGTLDAMLDRLASCQEKTEALKAKIKRAMIYPVAVLLVAAMVTGIMLVKVIPQFESTFSAFGAELPELTQLVVGMSHFMQEAWLACIIGLGLAVFAGGQAHKRFQAVRDSQQRLALKLPIIGDILGKSCAARFARTLATTSAAGVPLVDALGSAGGATGNV